VLRSQRSASSRTFREHPDEHITSTSVSLSSHALFPPQLRVYLFQTHRTLRRQGHRSCGASFRRGRNVAFRHRDALLPYVHYCLASTHNRNPSQPPVDVILPTLPWPWLSTLPCFLIIINLFTHYYFACTVSPGLAGEPPQRVGRSIIWAKKQPEYSLSRTNGVHWTSHLNITPASTTTCPKCGKTKPEVR
jgi:hypothetical protein